MHWKYKLWFEPACEEYFYSNVTILLLEADGQTLLKIVQLNNARPAVDWGKDAIVVMLPRYQMLIKMFI